MPIVPRILLVIVVAAAAAFGYRYYDTSRGAEWEVSPQQIAAAKAKGLMGLETSPGTVTVLPIRSETADVLPVQWGLAGLMAGIAVWAGTRRRHGYLSNLKTAFRKTRDE